MNKFTKTVLLTALTATFLASTAQAGWMIVEDNPEGAKLMDCCAAKKRVYTKPVKKVVKKVLPACNEIPTAQTFPIHRGEKLRPANVKACPSCDQEFGRLIK